MLLFKRSAGLKCGHIPFDGNPQNGQFLQPVMTPLLLVVYIYIF